MEKLLADLKTQLQLLNFTRNKSDGIIEKGNVEGVERQFQSLKSIVTRVEEFKLQIKKKKSRMEKNLMTCHNGASQLKPRKHLLWDHNYGTICTR